MESREFDSSQPVGVGVRLVEGSLSKAGKLNVYALVQYGKQQPWKSAVSARAGNKPKWNEYHVFDLCEADEVVITLFDKGYVFGDSELGRCTLSLADIRQDHFTEWWPVVAQDGSMVGQLLLTFNLPQEDSGLLVNGVVTRPVWERLMRTYELKRKRKQLVLKEASANEPPVKQVWRLSEEELINRLAPK